MQLLRPYRKLVILLFAAFFIAGGTSAQSSADFSGKWVGYMKVGDVPRYRIFANFTNAESKHITGGINLYDYDSPKKLVKSETAVFDYDKQKRIAFYHTTIPSPSGASCEGYLILKVDKTNTDSLEVIFRTNKDCMVPLVIMSRSNYFLMKDTVFAWNKLSGSELQGASPSGPPAPVPSTTAPAAPPVSSTTAPATMPDKTAKASQPANVNTTAPPVVMPPAAAMAGGGEITLGTDPDFRWYDWEKAPQLFKDASRFVHCSKNRQTGKDVLLYDQIMKYIKGGCTVQIAAVDLNANGSYGLAIFANGSYCCGSAGCSFELYDDGGSMTVDLGTDYGVSPAPSGVKASNGRFFPLILNTRVTITKEEVAAHFTYDKKTASAKPVATFEIPKDLTGAPTAEALARLLLKALVTNNKSLWASCVHPTYNVEKDPGVRKASADRFDDARRYFASNGVSDWSKVSFSRITFEECGKCAPPGEKWLTGMNLEFWYQGHEFLCGIAFTPVMTYKGKYFMGHAYDYGMERTKGK